MKLQNSLWNKYGESLEERSLTICSGTDYINVNYQHIVCPDAETAKVCIHVCRIMCITTHIVTTWHLSYKTKKLHIYIHGVRAFAYEKHFTSIKIIIRFSPANLMNKTKR